MSVEHLVTAAELLVMFSVIGTLVLLIIRMQYSTTYRLALGLALAAAFLILWINLAVGIIAEPDNPANLMYFGVIAVAITGAIIVRLQPGGMKRVMFVTATAQVLVALVTVFAALDEPQTWWWSLLGLNGFFAALWFGSACLFRKAALAQAAGGAGPESKEPR